MKRHLLNSLVALATLAWRLGTADFAYSIDINLVWDDLDENPDFDPDGTKLMAVAGAAAQIWERLIPSAGTHDVDVSWSELEPGQLGYWKLDPFGNNNIYFNKNSEWFVDSTPSDHSEYDFGSAFTYSTGKGSSLFGTTDNADNWFDGPDPPATLEIGYVGLPTDSSPVAAADNFDLLSVVLHELGHDLGVGGDELSGRYPIYPADISGVQDVEVFERNLDNPESEGYGEEHGHVAPPMALMSPSTSRGERTLPSAMDVLVAARDSNYLSVDLERKFVGIGTNWNSSSTWIGGRVPDGSDDAYVVDDKTITLSNSGHADNLFIGRNSIVSTGANSLTVDNLLALHGADDVLRIPTGGLATVGRIESPHHSMLELSGGTLNALNGGFIAGQLMGHGTADFDGQVVVTGSIEPDGGTLEVIGGGSILLLETDEFGSGRIRADGGDLKLGLVFAQSSSGSIRVDPGRRLVVTRDISIPRAVEVSLGGDLTSEGANTDVTIEHLNVESGNTGRVLSRTLTLNDYANVGNGGHLTLASPVRTTLKGGLLLSGGGTLKQEGDILVTGGEVRLGVDTLDWGNSTPTQSNELRISPNSTLEVDSEIVGAFRGQLTVDSAILQVDSPDGWQLGGESATTAGGILSLIQSGATTPTVRGAPFTARHWIIASGGDAFIQSDLTVASTAQVIVFGADAKLFLMGKTTLGGGSVSGLGTLVQRGDMFVTADTTIDSQTFSWGNSLGLDLNTLSVTRGDTLRVNSSSTGNANNQFRGTLRLDGGTLVVNTDDGWALPAGQTIQHPGVLELAGGIIAPRVQGQSLTVGGRIDVTGGAAHLDSDVVFQSTQRTDIAAGATLHVNGAANYLGGTFTGLGTLQHNGTALLSSNNPLTATRFLQNGLLTAINPSNNAAIHASVIEFLPGSLTRLFLDLHLQGDAILRPDATFEGNGTLVIDPTGSFAGGGGLGVDLENQGILRPGVSPGVLNVAGEYTQGASGTLEIDVAGTSRGDWDLLAASGNVSLHGRLEVLLHDGFTPALGDSFTIVTAAGGLSGAFSDTRFPPLPVGQIWSIDYSRTSAVLSTIIGVLGDTNGDLTVDLEDLNHVRNNFGGSGTGIDGDTDDDGVVDLSDLNNVRNNFGVSASQAVPEPSANLLAAVGLLAVMFATVRRCRSARKTGLKRRMTL